MSDKYLNKIYWVNDRPAKVNGYVGAGSVEVNFEFLDKNRSCPHCGGDLGKDYTQIIDGCLNWKSWVVEMTEGEVETLKKLRLFGLT